MALTETGLTFARDGCESEVGATGSNLGGDWFELGTVPCRPCAVASHYLEGHGRRSPQRFHGSKPGPVVAPVSFLIFFISEIINTPVEFAFVTAKSPLISDQFAAVRSNFPVVLANFVQVPNCAVDVATLEIA